VLHARLRQGRATGSSRLRPTRAALAVAVFGAGLTLYAWAVEPYWIEVTRHHVQAPLAERVVVAHLTDLHLYGLGRRERKMLALLEREKPDLIVLTGDYVINGDLFAPPPGLPDDPSYARVGPVFDRLRAPLGVYAVRGNWENVRRVKDEAAFYERHGVRLLLDEAREVKPGLWITGLNDTLFDPDLEQGAQGIPPSAFVIAAFHSPEYFDTVAGRWPLALAGHTHGGQVRPPFVPPFWLPAGSGRYLAGWYESKGSRLYVSRGVGTSTLPIRFLCRPEVALITIGPR
jgi:uncharacterized protein